MRRHLVTLSLYLLLFLALTWPTVTHLTTHLPGDGGDDPAIAWNLWWVKYALLNEGSDPFYSAAMFYPLGVNLAFYTLTVLNGLTALPLTLNLGVVGGSNLHMGFTFVMGAYGMALLTRYSLRQSRLSPHAAFAIPLLAGAFYAYHSSKLFYLALGQFNIASTHWIPFAVLFILRTRHQPRSLSNPLMAGLFLTLQAWAELTYASFLLIFLGLYGAWELLTQRSDIKLAVRNGAIIMLTFALGLSPILAHMLPDMLIEGDFFVEGSGFADAFSADLFGFFIPTMHHPLFGDLISHTNILHVDKGQHLYLGYTLLLLTLIPLLRWRTTPRPFYFWLMCSLIFTLLTLGPTIIINGNDTDIPGPFVIFQQLPFFKGNRYPSRYGVMLLLSLSLTAAYGCAALRPKIRLTAPLFALILGLFLFEQLTIPLPQSDMRPPAAYATLAETDGTLLDIPFAWRNGFRITGALTTQFMFGQFYQTAHQKPMIQGNTSRNPALLFQYFTSAPVINSLLALQTGQTLPPERWSHDAPIAAEVMQFFNIDTIVVRPDETGSDIITPQAAIPYIQALLSPELIHNEPTLKIYRLPTEPAAPRRLINSDSPTARLYFGEGWGIISPGQPVVAQRPANRLLLPPSNSITLTMKSLEGAPPIAISLKQGAWHSAPQPLTTEWQPYRFSLPPVSHSPQQLWLMVDSPTPAAAMSDVSLLSAGEAVGGFGHIFINGEDISPNQRGFNVAIIQADHVETAHFDTHLNPQASLDMAAFINRSLPPDTLVVAVSDEASFNLGAEAVTALHQQGATVDLRGCFRCSYGFIRQADGTVHEQVSRLDTVQLTTYLGLTEPQIGLLLQQIERE